MNPCGSHPKRRSGLKTATLIQARLRTLAKLPETTTSIKKSVMMKNFKRDEFKCRCGCNENEIQINVLYYLQTVRNILDEPITVTSGYRCEDHNAFVGGSPTSSHRSGTAADLAISDSGYGFRLMEAIFVSNRFKRVGYGKMGGVLVLHVDIDSSKDQEVLWGY
jgi:zinc D-Ala-D-Ala carboxypeptidase